MKNSIKNSINCTWLITPFLFATLVLAPGCAAPKRASNPLVGWHFYSRTKVSQAIRDDYSDYIKKLPPEERKYAGMIEFFENGEGQHAVKITIGLKGTLWAHVLVYDKENNRIKVTTYADGRYSQW